jgi:transposase, IS5 family
VGQRGLLDEGKESQSSRTKSRCSNVYLNRSHGIHFRPCLKGDYTQERKSNAGRKRIDPLILFKMLILQQLFNLSDEELEFQVNDRRSFEEFVGLDVMDNMPGATTIAFFR